MPTLTRHQEIAAAAAAAAAFAAQQANLDTTSWQTDVDSVDDIVKPSDMTVGSTNNRDPRTLEPLPEVENKGKNREISEDNLTNLQTRLRHIGLGMKLKPNSEIVEYDIFGLNGESSEWVQRQLALGAEADYQERKEREKKAAEKERKKQERKKGKGKGVEGRKTLEELREEVARAAAEREEAGTFRS